MSIIDEFYAPEFKLKSLDTTSIKICAVHFNQRMHMTSRRRTRAKQAASTNRNEILIVYLSAKSAYTFNVIIVFLAFI